MITLYYVQGTIVIHHFSWLLLLLVKILLYESGFQLMVTISDWTCSKRRSTSTVWPGSSEQSIILYTVTFSHTHIHTYTYTHTHIHTYTYTHTHIHIHIHIHTCTHTLANSQRESYEIGRGCPSVGAVKQVTACPANENAIKGNHNHCRLARYG